MLMWASLLAAVLSLAETVVPRGRTSRAGAVLLAEKIRTTLSETRFSVMDVDGQKQIHITASLGVAEYRGDERAFFNEADRALYKAKDSGKDCVVASAGELSEE